MQGSGRLGTNSQATSNGARVGRVLARQDRYLSGAAATIMLLVVGVAIFTQARPSEAVAAARGSVTKKVNYAVARLGVHHGYKLLIAGSDEGMSLIISRRHAVTQYLQLLAAPGPNGIHAQFGDRGRLDLAFHPRRRSSRKIRSVLSSCQPIGYADDSAGTFTGTVWFGGEGHISRVRLHRARGHMGSLKVRCSPPVHISEGHSGDEQLQIVARIPGGQLYAGPWAVQQIQPYSWSILRQLIGLGALSSGGIPLAVERQEWGSGGVLITRIAAAAMAAVNVTVGHGSHTVRLSPPSPFAGSAAFLACASEWNGGLSVEFPGKAVHLIPGGDNPGAYVLAPSVCEG